MANVVPLLLRPGDVVRVPHIAKRGFCRAGDLLYRVNEVENEWNIRVTRLDAFGRKLPWQLQHTGVGRTWLSRGKIVRRGMEVPPRDQWDHPEIMDRLWRERDFKRVYGLEG